MTPSQAQQHCVRARKQLYPRQMTTFQGYILQYRGVWTENSSSASTSHYFCTSLYNFRGDVDYFRHLHRMKLQN